MRALPAVLPLVLLALLGCDDPSAPSRSSGSPPVVVASNHPLAFFVVRLARDRVEVRLPVPEGVDPDTWRPTGDDVAEMSGADLVVLNGAGYESWLDTASLPADRVLDSSSGFRDRYLPGEGGVHSHGPGGEHSHAGTATHTWLDPDLAILQVQAILERLSSIIPAEQDAMQSNFGVLRRELLARSAGLEQAVNARSTTPVLFSHPVYQYLQRRYRMNGAAVDWTPDVTPDEADIAELDDLVAGQPTRWFVWTSEPSPANRALLEARGIESVVFDPAGARPTDGDYLDVLDRNVDAVRRIYGVEPDSDG